jgi:hypothetical protein
MLASNGVRTHDLTFEAGEDIHVSDRAATVTGIMEVHKLILCLTFNYTKVNKTKFLLCLIN